MQHSTRIDNKPAGKKRLQFTGPTPNGTLRHISVVKGDSLVGDQATGNCDDTNASITVSITRFDNLSTRAPSFTIVIEADAEGVVSACTVTSATGIAA
jgi:hypothetical protein